MPIISNAMRHSMERMERMETTREISRCAATGEELDAWDRRRRLDDPRPLTSTVSATLPQQTFLVTAALTLAPDPQTSPDSLIVQHRIGEKKKERKEEGKKDHGRIESEAGSEGVSLGDGMYVHAQK